VPNSKRRAVAWRVAARVARPPRRGPVGGSPCHRREQQRRSRGQGASNPPPRVPAHLFQQLLAFLRLLAAAL
jgi:hypothetical protein